MNRVMVALASVMALGTAGQATAKTAAAAAWYGEWDYSQRLPRDNGGMVPFIDHKLTLDDSGCTISIEGYQSNSRIRCNARVVGNSLKVTFRSFGDGRLVNEYDVALFKPGASLFTLARSSRGVVTNWGELKPDGVRRSGLFFRRN